VVVSIRQDYLHPRGRTFTQSSLAASGVPLGT